MANNYHEGCLEASEHLKGCSGERVCPSVTLFFASEGKKFLTFWPNVLQGRRIQRPRISWWHTREDFNGINISTLMCRGGVIFRLMFGFFDWCLAFSFVSFVFPLAFSQRFLKKCEARWHLCYEKGRAIADMIFAGICFPDKVADDSTMSGWSEQTKRDWNLFEQFSCTNNSVNIFSDIL